MKRIKNILISQIRDENTHYPYIQLEEQYDVKVNFHSFIDVKPVSMRTFFKQKVNISDYTAIVFTSKKSIDYFFAICENIKIELLPTVKYFFISKQTSNYLHKYIVVRKRKVFIGNITSTDLFPVLLEHKKEKFLYPCSSIRKNDIPDFLQKNEFDFTELVIYETISNDLRELDYKSYDLFVFFSPSGIKSLFDNFPSFEQKNTVIAAFGPTTAQAARDYGLKLAIEAPLPNVPSMKEAIENYIKQYELFKI